MISRERIHRMLHDRLVRKILFLGVIVFGYMFFGTLVYSWLEGWSLVNAFYFTGVTLSTVGYGDLTPTHAASRIFTVFYALLGVGIVFYSIGIVGKYYVEQEERRLARIVDSVIGKRQTQTKLSEALESEISKKKQ